MTSLIENIPAILRESGDLFSLLGLIAILGAAMHFLPSFFPNKTELKQQTWSILLFLLGLAVAALFGLRTGAETASLQEPNLVELSPKTSQQVEEHLVSKGQSISEESRTQVIEEALIAYLNPNREQTRLRILPSESEAATSRTNSSSDNETSSTETSGNNRSEESLEVAKEVTFSESAIELSGFLFELQSCARERQTVTCTIFVTNRQKDRVLYLYGKSDWGTSRIVDSQGNVYLANSIKFASYQGERWIKINTVQEIRIRAELIFEEVSSQVNQLTLLELAAQDDDDNQRFSAQFRDVAVSSS